MYSTNGVVDRIHNCWIESVPYGTVTLDEMKRSSTTGEVDRIHDCRIESVAFGIITLDEMERRSTTGAVDRILNFSDRIRALWHCHARRNGAELDEWSGG